MNVTLENIISTEHLKTLYHTQIALKNIKGVDGISVNNFQEEIEFSIIQRKCLNSTYNFSCYLEKLILKGANKKPRIISIATIRDRLLLLALKEFLSEEFKECINHELPNNKVGKIYQYLQEHPNIQFIKTDIKGFYENIDHNLLIQLLRKKIRDNRIIKLVENAIKTPTVSCISQDKINKKGVPQGLAISNILAEIYLYEVDQYLKNCNFFYSRYVDDILIVQSTNIKQTKKTIKKMLTQKHLFLNQEKTQYGTLKKGVLFLGYLITSNSISIPEKKVSLFINRIAGLFYEYDKLLSHEHLRPIIFKDDQDGLSNYFIEILNKKITGARSQHRRYGWIAYYSQLTDLSILFRIDKIINDFCLKSKILNNHRPKILKSIVRAYFEMKHNPDSKYIYNYDDIDTIPKKRKELLNKNFITSKRFYSDEQIEFLYEKSKQKEIFSYEKDLDMNNGSISG